MKKFIKGRWFPLAIAAIIVAALIIFLGCIGFRITYNPALESSWDAVSAFAAWSGVIMSFAAIVTAVRVPQKIADKQDKIALFEKRYDLYNTVCSCMRVARLIAENYIENSDGAYRWCWRIFAKDFSPEHERQLKVDYQHNWGDFLQVTYGTADKLKEAAFLFSGKTKEFVQDLGKVWEIRFGVYDGSGYFKQWQQEFSSLHSRFKNDSIREEMEKMLNLKEM